MHHTCLGKWKFPYTFLFNRIKRKCPRTFPMHLDAPHVLRYMQISMYLSNAVPSCTTRDKANENFQVPFPCTFMHHTCKGTWKSPCTFMHYVYTCKGALWKFPCMFLYNTIKDTEKSVSMYLQMTKKVYMEISTHSYDDTAIQLLQRSLLYECVRWPVNAI